MGMFDDITVGDRTGQVKLFSCTLTSYTVGDSVGAVAKNRDYDIVMREGGYVHVRDCRITGWDDTNDPNIPTFDKWGGKWDGVGDKYNEVGKALMELEGTPPTYFHN